MTLRVEIHWDNPGSPLLAQAVIYLMVDGIGRSADSESKGVQRYDLPDATTSIELQASFTADFREVVGDGSVISARAFETLHIDQELEVTKGKIRARHDPRFGGRHPLVKISSAKAVNGVTILHLRTRFVDITLPYSLYASGWKYYQSQRDPDARLRVLGYTGGAPAIWLASFGKQLETHVFRRPGALVFFRPASYAYTRVDQPHNMAGPIRYLTAPVPKSSTYWERSYQHADPDKYFYIRCGFEDALVRSDRPVVMLHPWPSGANFGHAQSKQLRGLARDAIRYLWGDQHIYRDRKVMGFGRLGVSGFSLGGGGAFSALVHGKRSIDELFLFDCTHSHHYRGHIKQWFLSRRAKPGRSGTPCLRMIGGGYNINTYAAIESAIAATLGESSVAQVTATPKTETMYASGHNPLWDHVVKEDPGRLRGDEDQRHQFSVHGGNDPFGPGASVETYLLRCLKDSRFGVP